MGLLSGASTVTLPHLGKAEHSMNAEVTQTRPEYLRENLLKAFSCFGPKFPWIAVSLTLFGWCTGESSHALCSRGIHHWAAPVHHGFVPFMPPEQAEKQHWQHLTWTQHLVFPPAFNCWPKTESGKGSVRRWERGRDRMWRGGKRDNTEPCWKSSFHECEIIMWVFSTCSCQIPVLRVDGIYCCVSFLFILALFLYVLVSYLNSAWGRMKWRVTLMCSWLRCLSKGDCLFCNESFFQS